MTSIEKISCQPLDLIEETAIIPMKLILIVAIQNFTDPFRVQLKCCNAACRFEYQMESLGWAKGIVLVTQA